MLKRYLSPFTKFIFLGHFLSVIIGLSSALIAVLVGPAIQVLVEPETGKIFGLEQFLGKDLGIVFTKMLVAIDAKTEFNFNELLAFLPVFLVVFATLKSLAVMLQWYIWEFIGEKVSQQVRHDLAQSFLETSYTNGLSSEHTASENLSSSMGQDTRLLREFIVHFMGGFPREGLQVLFLMITTIFLSPKLFLIFFVIILPLFALLSRLGKKIRRRADKMLRDYADVSEWLQQRLLGIETIKHYKTEEFEQEGFKALLKQLTRRLIRAARAKVMTSPMIEFTGICAFSIVLWISFQQLSLGKESGAVLLSFFSSLILLAQSGAKLGKYFNSNKEAKSGIERIRTILSSLQISQLQDVVKIVSTQDAHEKITLNGIYFRYPVSNKNTLENFSRTFECGKVYCIVGPSGVGKSTLFKIMLGLERPSAGTVNLSLSAQSREEKRNLPICFVPQQFHLTSETILDHLTYPCFEAVDHQRLKKALEKVDLWEHCEHKLPLKLLTPANISGLSGGQVQRLFLARMIYLDSPFNLIDEGTSALDSLTETKIMESIAEMKAKGRCVVMIAHRNRLKEFADEVVLLA